MRDKQIRRRFFLLSRLGRDRKEIDAPRVLRLELSLTHSNFGQSRDKGTSKNCPARSTAMKPPLIDFEFVLGSIQLRSRSCRRALHVPAIFRGPHKAFFFAASGLSIGNEETARRKHRHRAREIVMYLVAGLVRMLRVRRRYNESLRELNRLDDRELADIGITRCDIQRIAWEGARG